MNRGMAGMAGMAALVALGAGCNRDKQPEQAQVPVAIDTTARETPAAPRSPGAAGPAAATKTAAQPARPAAADPAGAAAAAAELASARRVFTVQVAALPGGAGGRWWAEKLRAEGLPAYTIDTIVDYREVTRLRIGAAVTAAEARALADRIRAQYKWPVWITVVPDKSVLPANALSASRVYVAGT